MDINESPDYLKAADLHNLGAGNESFFSDPLGQTADFISATPSFAISSIASGINSIYNSGVVAGNFFGLTDANENDLQQTLGSYDSNLGDYYGAHKGLADAAGFIVTSFVPGVGGVKLLNAGQRVLGGAIRSGELGAGLAESTGLIRTLAGSGKSLTQLAGEGLAQSQQTFTVMNAGVIKALAAGVGQAAMDSFAFEAMVQATMFKSPVLEGQDLADVGKNLVTATLLGGGIGGLLNSAGVYGGVKKILTARDLELKPVTQMRSTVGLETSDKMATRALDMLETPAATGTDTLMDSLRVNKLTSIRQDIRSGAHELVAGDVEFGNHIGDMLDTMDPNQIVNIVGGAKQIARPGSNMVAGEGESIAYAKLYGTDGVGDISFTPLNSGDLSIADSITSSKGATARQNIDKFVADQKFSLAKPWNPITAASPLEIEARYVWAETKASYKNGMTIHSQDIPLQEGALRAGLTNVEITDGIHSYKITNLDDLQNELLRNKQDLVNELGGKGAQKAGWAAGMNPEGAGVITAEQVAKAANVPVKAIESEPLTVDNMFARKDAQIAYDKMRSDTGITTGNSDLTYIPQHAAIKYDATRAADVTYDTVSAQLNVAYANKILREKLDNAVATIAGPLNDRFPKIPASQISGSNRYGAGAGVVTSANAAPNSLGSTMEYIGKATADLITQTKKRTADIVDSISLRLRNDQAATVEFSKLNDLRNSTTEKYILNEAGDGLIAAKTQEYRDAVKAGGKGLSVPQLQEGAPDEILFKNPLAGEAITADIQANGYRVQNETTLRNAEGRTNNKDPNTFYGWKPDPRSMPFFAFVKDESLVGGSMGHTSMIHAASESELTDMIRLVNEKTGFRVYTKGQAEDFYKARQEYNFDRTIHENYMDSALKSAGVNNSFLPKTDANNIVDEWLAAHSKRDASLARDTVATKYSQEFDQLSQLGDQYTGIAASRAGVTSKSVEGTVKNPYNDYIKTALNISKMSEYPILNSVNTSLENVVSGTVQKLVDSWKSVTQVSKLDAANDALKAAGISHSYGTAAEMLLANHIAAKPYLSNFIRGANTILANTFLRLDFLNPLTNALGAQVLLGKETSEQVKSLLRDVDVAGINVPGTSATILSPLKMVAKANADYLKSTPELDALFQSEKLTISTRQQMKDMLDQISIEGLENQAQSQTRLGQILNAAQSMGNKIGDVGEKVTGNRLAEEYNRWVAAHVAKQIADVRIANGLMPADGLGAFMNTFVNRTQTNTLASQRPLLFQGPLGQALGLFQSFQFNTMQQLFKSVSEGTAKDAAMAMGLQSTIFGLNGLPGFQYINQHILGTASGNPNHTDAYSTLYGAAGKTAGDWLMYGVPSNILQTNMYSRGDINPRTLTVIPNAPQDIVAVSAFSKFAGDLYNTLGNIAGGGNIWESVLQGFEHNGLSRPLAGLAQTLQATTTPSGKVFSTTGKGDVSFVNDVMSLATLSRLAGGKPLDEAIANDQISRAMVYQAADHKRMNNAAETFKTTVVGDTTGNVTPEAVHNYLDAFVHNGGDPTQFNKNMLGIMTQVNTPRANKIMESLKNSSYAATMKSLMGGQQVEDLNQQ